MARVLQDSEPVCHSLYAMDKSRRGGVMFLIELERFVRQTCLRLFTPSLALVSPPIPLREIGRAALYR